MVTTRRSGFYKLIETKHHTRMLYLGEEVYAWLLLPAGAEILVSVHTIHSTDNVLSMGHYRLYDVQGELHLSDHQHLELQVGEGHWQGYLLLTGLPDSRKKRSRIIPTHEVITGKARSTRRKEVRRNVVTTMKA